MIPLSIFPIIALFIPFILLLAPLKKPFSLSKRGAGAKAMGKEKGILGANKTKECEIHDGTLLSGEEPEPTPPKEIQKNGTRPKALKIYPTQNGRGRSPST
jgi:hypothetical protein